MKLKLIRQISAAAAVGLVANALTATAATASSQAAAGPGATTTLVAAAHFTTTPIKHVVVIIGENHSFDNVFATYHSSGQAVAPPAGEIENPKPTGVCPR